MLKQYKKTLILTSLILLIPVVIGLLLWNRLPLMTGAARPLPYSVCLHSCWLCSGSVRSHAPLIPSTKITTPRCLSWYFGSVLPSV